ncbi:MAG: ATP synthase subunit I [Rhodopseudomonas sp.]|uniref:ATP synthase subunit I n=1 Tax=Rhodopseudomonas sp. TaxID=1078 RepID=UPI001794532F|nr:ATP synthase subunit I [Rhodopseudomonas sp.]NVN84935.1 ATP synthase subunit I [Rhodopseudomonas sp.]
MTEFMDLAPAFAAGLLLGAMFFGGLWWTVRRGISSPRPALWFFGSMLLRMAIALTGFLVVGGERWERWLLCLVGFVLARFAVQWLTQPDRRAAPRSETSYAP